MTVEDTQINTEIQPNKIETKSFELSNEFEGIIEAYACTYGNIDRHNEVLVKGCFAEWLSNPENQKRVRFFGGHNHNGSVGLHLEAIDTDKGLRVKAQIFDEAVNDTGVPYKTLVQTKAIDQLSVGFVVKEDEYDENGVRYITKANLLEYSLVPIPANPKAVIISAKSMENQQTSLLSDVKNINDFENILKTHYNFNDRDIEAMDKALFKLNYRAKLLKNVKTLNERDNILKTYYGFENEDVKAIKYSLSTTKTNEFKDILKSISNKLNLCEKDCIDLEGFFKENKWLDIEEKSMYNTQIGTQGVKETDEEEEEDKKKKELEELENSVKKALDGIKILDLEKQILDN